MGRCAADRPPPGDGNRISSRRARDALRARPAAHARARAPDRAGVFCDSVAAALTLRGILEPSVAVINFGFRCAR